MRIQVLLLTLLVVVTAAKKGNKSLTLDGAQVPKDVQGPIVDTETNTRQIIADLSLDRRGKKPGKKSSKGRPGMKPTMDKSCKDTQNPKELKKFLAYLDNNIANLNSSSLEHFQMDTATCSNWDFAKCTAYIIKDLGECALDIPDPTKWWDCVDKFKADLGYCWPCISRVCCYENWKWCCDHTEFINTAPEKQCELHFCENIGDCDQGCSKCQKYEINGIYYGVCEGVGSTTALDAGVLFSELQDLGIKNAICLGACKGGAQAFEDEICNNAPVGLQTVCHYLVHHFTQAACDTFCNKWFPPTA